MVGLGGGFIVVPVLRLFFGMPPAAAAADSLALVLANSVGGSVSYFLARRVDWRTGLLVASGGLPGGILGAIAVKYTSSQIFDWLLATLLIAGAIDIARRSPQARLALRTTWHKSWYALIALGFGVGIISSLFGIGGGLALVPALFYFTNLPAHAVSATSQFGILLTSPVGLGAHIAQHDVRWAAAIPLILGGLVGGPIGAGLSGRVRSLVLLRLMAFALVLAAIALAVRHFLAAH